MKFVKGMITGMVVTAGVAMMYTEYFEKPNKIVKQGKKIIKKLGF
jgi:hypothetical protein